MTTLILELYNITVCTANNARYRDGSRTLAARVYMNDIHREMVYNHTSDIQEFKRQWDKVDDKDKELSLDIEILVPKGRMRTKQGVISRKSIDIDNYIKMLIDAAMDSKYHMRKLLKSDRDIITLEIDDKFITSLNVCKRENPQEEDELWSIKLEFSFV